MEKELDSKIFMTINYMNKNDMKVHIEEYIRKLKNEYPTAIITKEFYNGENILVRAKYQENRNKSCNRKQIKEKEIDDWYIRQRGER